MGRTDGEQDDQEEHRAHGHDFYGANSQLASRLAGAPLNRLAMVICCSQEERLPPATPTAARLRLYLPPNRQQYQPKL